MPLPHAPVPMKPRIIELALVVDMPETDGVDTPLTDIALGGKDVLESQGFEMLAPLTPNATSDSQSVAPLSVMVIVSLESVLVASAHHTSLSTPATLPAYCIMSGDVVALRSVQWRP